MDNRMLFKRDMKEKQELVNIILDRFLPRKDEYPKEIHKAIRYSLFAGGKRLRPLLCMHAWQLFQANSEPITYVAAALEMMHTYSLIHDDLPDVDNDEYRRGKLSCHAMFGEDVALLAGDALLIGSYELIAWAPLPESVKKEMLLEMGNVCGANGMIAGQMLDILSEGKKPDKQLLQKIHTLKTAMLINLSLYLGARAANAPADDLKALEEFGTNIGLAFQIVDDLLDIEGNQTQLGKTPGKDMAVGKQTFPAVYGVEKSRQMAQDYKTAAKNALQRFGKQAIYLDMLADMMVDRNS